MLPAGDVAPLALAEGWLPFSPRVTALRATLESLGDASEAIADAVLRHDHDALLAANERTDRLVAELGRAGAGLSADDLAELAAAGIPVLCERLRASARRNAYLIETAWALDAATMRLLAGLGKLAAEGGLRQYAEPQGPAYVDRQA
jgi:hypothetical protein